MCQHHTCITSHLKFTTYKMVPSNYLSSRCLARMINVHYPCKESVVTAISRLGLGLRLGLGPMIEQQNAGGEVDGHC